MDLILLTLDGPLSLSSVLWRLRERDRLSSQKKKEKGEISSEWVSRLSFLYILGMLLIFFCGVWFFFSFFWVSFFSWF